MGLKVITITAVAGFLLAAGCASNRIAIPADRVANETFRFDCCDPGLDADTKWWCDRAKKEPNRIYVDAVGNKMAFVWSDCAIGEEPWRKWE